MRNVVVTNIGKESVIGLEAFRHYRENARFRDKTVTRVLSNYKAIVSKFYQKIGEALVEEEGGVFIKGLGYFSIVMHPQKQMVKVPYKKEGFANFQTKNYLYTPMFIGIAKGNPLINFWVMDRTFSRRKVRTPLHKALISGKKFKTFVSTISSLYSIKNK